MSASILGDLTLTIDHLKAKLAESNAEISKFKKRAEEEGHNSGKSLANGLREGLKENLGEIQKAGIGRLMGAFGLAGGAMGAFEFFKGLTEKAHEIHNMALTLGESAESVQRVGKAAKLSGMDVEGIQKAFVHLQAAMGAGGEKDKVFKDLGLDAADLMAMPLEDKVIAMAGAFEEAKKKGTGYHDLLELLGKSGANLIPLLAHGSDSLRKMFSKSIIPEETIERLAEMNVKLQQANNWVSKMGAAWAVHGSSFARTVDDAITSMMRSGIPYDKAVGDSLDKQEVEHGASVDEMRNQRQEAKETAKRMRELQEQEENEKGLKEAEKHRDSIRKGEESEMADPDKLEALGKDLAAAMAEAAEKVPQYKETLDRAGEENTPENLKQFAEGSEQLKLGKDAEAAWEKYRAILEIQQEMARLQKHMAEEDDRQTKEAERQAKELATAREESRKKSLEVMSPAQEMTALRQHLADTFGLQIKEMTGVAVAKGLGALEDKVAAAKESGDPKAEMDAMKELDAARDETKRLAGMAPNRGTYSPQGATVQQLNLLTGKSDDMVLTEARKQTSVMERLSTILSKWDQTMAQMQGFGHSSQQY